ncbi:Uncharacterised protein [Serratia quinivorans]|nr:Uncharacterised protein [Serratia quinivorans]CAI1851530.1 Uncharacterised protein [Serratia quinivorans]
MSHGIEREMIAGLRPCWNEGEGLNPRTMSHTPPLPSAHLATAQLSENALYQQSSVQPE